MVGKIITPFLMAKDAPVWMEDAPGCVEVAPTWMKEAPWWTKEVTDCAVLFLRSNIFNKLEIQPIVFECNLSLYVQSQYSITSWRTVYSLNIYGIVMNWPMVSFRDVTKL